MYMNTQRSHGVKKRDIRIRKSVVKNCTTELLTRLWIPGKGKENKYSLIGFQLTKKQTQKVIKALQETIA